MPSGLANSVRTWACSRLKEQTAYFLVGRNNVETASRDATFIIRPRTEKSPSGAPLAPFFRVDNGGEGDIPDGTRRYKRLIDRIIVVWTDAEIREDRSYWHIHLSRQNGELTGRCPLARGL